MNKYTVTFYYASYGSMEIEDIKAPSIEKAQEIAIEESYIRDVDYHETDRVDYSITMTEKGEPPTPNIEE